MINYYIPEDIEDIKISLKVISLHNELTRLINEGEVLPPKGLYPYLANTNKKGKAAGIEVMQFILKNLNLNLDCRTDIPEYIHSLCKINVLSEMIQTEYIAFYSDKSSIFKPLFNKEPMKGDTEQLLFNYNYDIQQLNLLSIMNPQPDKIWTIDTLVQHIKNANLSYSELLLLIKKII